MFDTIIMSGGNIDKDFALDFLRKTEYKKIAAADRGLEFCYNNGIVPQIAIGDFDSVSKEFVELYEKQNSTEIIRLKPEKDDSDTQSACKLLAKRGDSSIAILGGTGTRLDHVYANFELLAYMKDQNVKVVLVDANNYISILTRHTILKKEEQFGKYVSFFPLGNEVKGLSLQGFKYPLENFDLRVRDGGLTVSNELLDKEGSVTFQQGTLLMIMSKD